jgi:type IV pilus assembly protein PilE
MGFRRSFRRANSGFTLFDVLAVVASMSVVTAIALPSYTHQLRKSARDEARSFLAAAAASQEAFLRERRRYAGSLEALRVKPPAGLAGKYTFVVAAGDGPPSFTLTATATSVQADDACPTLTLDSRGGKGPDSCW